MPWAGPGAPADAASAAAGIAAGVVASAAAAAAAANFDGRLAGAAAVAVAAAGKDLRLAQGAAGKHLEARRCWAKELNQTATAAQKEAHIALSPGKHPSRGCLLDSCLLEGCQNWKANLQAKYIGGFQVQGSVWLEGLSTTKTHAPAGR